MWFKFQSWDLHFLYFVNKYQAFKKMPLNQIPNQFDEIL
jgi:hypothetical protein